MEALLRELIELNREILAELKGIRQGLGRPAAQSFPGQAEEPKPQAKLPTGRLSAQDLEDIRGSLLQNIKQRNADKRDAFSEFEKLHKKN